MKLYLIHYDGEPYYIEAETFTWAIETWHGHVKDLWGSDYDGSENPESVALIHESPVVRQKPTDG